MEINDTNDTSELDQQGKNDDGSEGDGTTQDQPKSEETLTKAQVIEIVKKAKADAKRAAKLEYDESVKGKHILTEDELTARLDAYKAIVLEEKGIEDLWSSKQKAGNYNDTQILAAKAIVTDHDEKSIDEALKLLFPAQVKPAPELRSGNIQQDKQQDVSPNAELNARLLADIRKINPNYKY